MILQALRWEYLEADLASIQGFQVKFDQGEFQNVNPITGKFPDTPQPFTSFIYVIPPDVPSGPHKAYVRARTQQIPSAEVEVEFFKINIPQNVRVVAFDDFTGHVV